MPEVRHHFRWDLDKTYLRTEFDTFKDLIRTFRQSAAEKRSVPGARTLLQELLKPGPGEPARRLTFISGSPRQMRRVLTEKLHLDGIQPDAFILKPNLSNLLKFRFKALRGQVGFKLSALLQSRADGPAADETLFGDDAERDAFIYSLYADVVDRRLESDQLEAILNACHVYRREMDEILDLCQQLPRGMGRVKRIYILLDRRSPTLRFAEYGARVVALFNYFQAALLLHNSALLAAPSLLRVVEAMSAEGYTAVKLANSMQDLVRRGFLHPSALQELEKLAAQSADTLDGLEPRFREEFRTALDGTQGAELEPPAWRDEIDYVTLAERSKFKRVRTQLPGLRWLR